MNEQNSQGGNQSSAGQTSTPANASGNADTSANPADQAKQPAQGQGIAETDEPRVMTHAEFESAVAELSGKLEDSFRTLSEQLEQKLSTFNNENTQRDNDLKQWCQDQARDQGQAIADVREEFVKAHSDMVNAGTPAIGSTEDGAPASTDGPQYLEDRVEQLEADVRTVKGQIKHLV